MIMTGVFVEEKEVRGVVNDTFFVTNSFVDELGIPSGFWIGQFVHFKDTKISLQIS